MISKLRTIVGKDNRNMLTHPIGRGEAGNRVDNVVDRGIPRAEVRAHGFDLREFEVRDMFANQVEPLTLPLRLRFLCQGTGWTPGICRQYGKGHFRVGLTYPR